MISCYKVSLTNYWEIDPVRPCITTCRGRTRAESSDTEERAFMAMMRVKAELVNKFNMTEQQTEQELDQSIVSAREGVDGKLGRSS